MTSDFQVCVTSYDEMSLTEILSKYKYDNV